MISEHSAYHLAAPWPAICWETLASQLLQSRLAQTAKCDQRFTMARTVSSDRLLASYLFQVSRPAKNLLQAYVNLAAACQALKKKLSL